MKSYKEVYSMVNGLQKKAGANDVPVATQLIQGAYDRALNAPPVGELNEYLGWGPNFTRTPRLNRMRDILSAMARNYNYPIYGLRPKDRSIIRNLYNNAVRYTNQPAPQVYTTPGIDLDALGFDNFIVANHDPRNFRSNELFRALRSLKHYQEQE